MLLIVVDASLLADMLGFIDVTEIGQTTFSNIYSSIVMRFNKSCEDNVYIVTRRSTYYLEPYSETQDSLGVVCSSMKLLTVPVPISLSAAILFLLTPCRYCAITPTLGYRIYSSWYWLQKIKFWSLRAGACDMRPLLGILLTICYAK